MKRTIPRIFCTAMVFVLAFSLFGVFMPASPVEAADLKWSEINNPNSTGTYATFVIAGSEVIDIEVCSDGTMFAAFQDGGLGNAFYKDPVTGLAMGAGEYAILKSTNGGTIWSPTNFDPTAAAIVDIASSPNYDSDTTLWVAGAATCFRTINGGTTFGTVSWGATPAPAAITSVDVAPDYNGTGLNVVVGTVEAPARVLLYKTSEGEWKDLTTGLIPLPTAAFVTFSPMYESDGEIVAAITDGVDTYIQACFSERNWNSEVMNAKITGIPAASAAIGFPDDYDAISTNQIFVGVDSGLAVDTGDVYRIIGQRPPEAASVPVDLNCHAAGVYDVGSIVVSGTIAATPTVIIGSADSAEVRKTANPLDTTPSWKTDKKGPSGATNTSLAAGKDFATSGVIYAGTCGADSALSRSNDSGSIFNGIALIDTVVAAISDVAAYSTDVIFLITNDGAAAAESLWRTTNGGKAWERIFADADMATIKVSPSYGTDSTFYVVEAAPSISMWKSSNGGDTITGISAKAAVTAWAVIDGSTVITGAVDNKLYKTTNSGLRWTTSKTLPTQVSATMAVSPNYKNDSTILLGTNAGRVYISTDGGTNFKRLGTSGPGGAEDIYVAFDSGFDKNGFIYAGLAGAGAAPCIARWNVNDSSSWDALDGTDAIGVRALANVGGVLYASDCTPSTAVVGGIWRTVNPLAPLAYVAFDVQCVVKGMNAGTTLGPMATVSGSTAIFAIDTTGIQLQGYKDILSSATTIAAPKDGASVPKSNEATLSWAPMTGALTYDYQYSLNADYSNKTNPADIDGTSVVVGGLDAGTKYYWRVRSATPVISPWVKSSFITSLGNPALTSPSAFDQAAASVNPSFAWNAVPGAVSYELQVSDNPFYANAWVKKPLEHTVWMWEDTLEYATTYYWRVKAYSTGTESKWTEGTFTTIPEPTEAAAPVINVQTPPATQAPAPTPVIIPTPIASGYLWAIIIIGAVLVIALVVLIVRTRRVV